MARSDPGERSERTEPEATTTYLFDVTSVAKNADGSEAGKPESGQDVWRVEHRGASTLITHSGFTKDGTWTYEIDPDGSLVTLGIPEFHLDGTLEHAEHRAVPAFPLFLRAEPPTPRWRSEITHPSANGPTQYFSGQFRGRSRPPGGGPRRIQISLARSYNPATPHDAPTNWERTEYWLDAAGIPVAWQRFMFGSTGGYQEETAIRR